MTDDFYCRRPITNLATGQVLPLGHGAQVGRPEMFARYQRNDIHLCGQGAKFFERA